VAKTLPLTRRALRESWRGLLGWIVGLLATLGLYLPLYPSIAGPDMLRLIESLPEALVQALGYDQITSGAGYTQATFFGLVGFALVSIAVISWGAGAGGGHEESGRLELDLAHRVSRSGFVGQALLTLQLKLVLLGLVVWGAIAALNAPSELNLSLPNLAWTVLALMLLGLATGSVALAGGIVSGRKAGGVAAGATITIGGYALTAVGNLAGDVTWISSFSPYTWAFGQAPLQNGADLLGLGLLGALAVAGALASLVGLRRRDVLG